MSSLHTPVSRQSVHLARVRTRHKPKKCSEKNQPPYLLPMFHVWCCYCALRLVLRHSQGRQQKKCDGGGGGEKQQGGPPTFCRLSTRAKRGVERSFRCKRPVCLRAWFPRTCDFPTWSGGAKERRLSLSRRLSLALSLSSVASSAPTATLRAPLPCVAAPLLRLLPPQALIYLSIGACLVFFLPSSFDSLRGACRECV
jgi:hypothetical protein